MFFRVFAVLIVIFWLTMTTLLIRNEIGTGDSRLREIPVAHVMKLVFMHEQPSELNIFLEKRLMGTLRVHPHIRRPDQTRLIDFSGNLQLFLPRIERQRFSWDGSIEMTRALEVQHARVGVNLREPASYRVDVTFEPQQKLGQIETRSGGRLLDSQPFTLDERGVAALLQRFEIDQDVVRLAESQVPAERVELTARLSSLQTHGDRIDTYVVTFKQGSQTLGEVQLSQLGQILRATTFLGYTLVPDELLP